MNDELISNWKVTYGGYNIPLDRFLPYDDEDDYSDSISRLIIDIVSCDNYGLEPTVHVLEDTDTLNEE